VNTLLFMRVLSLSPSCLISRAGLYTTVHLQTSVKGEPVELLPPAVLRSWDDSEVRHTGTGEDAEAESPDEETAGTGKPTLIITCRLSFPAHHKALLVSSPSLAGCHLA